MCLGPSTDQDGVHKASDSLTVGKPCKKKIQRVHHSGCQYKSVDPEKQTNDDSKVNTVTLSLAESKNTAEVLKGRYKDYKYLRKAKVKYRSITQGRRKENEG